MKGCSRVGDISTGHICYPGSALLAPSSAPVTGPVFVNGRLGGRVGDLYSPHACPCANCPPPHTIRPISQGPPNVYFNGRPPGRTGDMIGCGDTIGAGSFNVFAGAV